MGRYEIDGTGARQDHDDIEEPLWGGGKPFQFNEKRDIPMLLHVRDATFVTNDQMLRFFLARKLELNRQCFRWRLQRLINGKLIQSFPEILPYRGSVYTLTRYGLSVLESCGRGLAHLHSASERLPNRLQAPHFLELNAVKQNFEESGLLQKWRPECELTSLSYVTDAPYVKDYDAIAEIELNREEFRIAIEYERSLKSSARYKQIADAINGDASVDMVLYLSSTVNSVLSLASEFRKPGIPMAFACSWILKDSGLNTNVLLKYGDLSATYSLRYALENIILSKR